MTEEELYTFIKIKLVEAGNMTEKELSKMVGMSQQNLNRKLKNGRLTYIEVNYIADKLGYEIIWQKKDPVKE